MTDGRRVTERGAESVGTEFGGFGSSGLSSGWRDELLAVDLELRDSAQLRKAGDVLVAVQGHTFSSLRLRSVADASAAAGEEGDPGVRPAPQLRQPDDRRRRDMSSRSPRRRATAPTTALSTCARLFEEHRGGRDVSAEETIPAARLTHGVQDVSVLCPPHTDAGPGRRRTPPQV